MNPVPFAGDGCSGGFAYFDPFQRYGSVSLAPSSSYISGQHNYATFPSNGGCYLATSSLGPNGLVQPPSMTLNLYVSVLAEPFLPRPQIHSMGLFRRRILGLVLPCLF